jgi:polyhydroxyalkanoate synthase
MFTLAGSGHIAEIVRPPGSSTAHHWVRDDCPPDAEEWLKGATQVEGSWWEHWAEWVAQHAGGLVAPPDLPDGDLAPGSYVLG